MAPLAPAVSVVIPTRNAGAYFARVMEGVRNQEGVAIRRVMVADSRSADETREIAASFGAEIMDVDPETFDHGLTRLRAVRRTRTDLVVLMTQDALVADRRVFAKMAKHFADGRVAGVCVRQRPRDDLDALANRRWQRLNRQARQVIVQELPAIRYARLAPHEKMQLCAFDDACSMIRREALEGHPFRRTPFAEDRLWARDVIRAGWRIIYDGNIEVIHSHAPALRERLSRAFVNHRAMYRYFGYRFASDPLDLAIYAAKAAHVAFLDTRCAAGTPGDGVREAAAALAETLAALAGLLAGIQQKELR